MTDRTTDEAAHDLEIARDASLFARVALVIYILLIVYASGYPFSGWQSTGLSPWDYIGAPFPHYWTRFDVLTNIIAYVPFGVCFVLAVHPYLRGAAAVLAAILGGALLTGAVEAAQTFLPSRVSSNLDFVSNLAGATAGAVAGQLLSHKFFTHSRLLLLRQHWFLPDAGAGMILLALWPLAQIYPQEYVFGHGQLTAILSGWFSALMSTPIDLNALALQGRQLTIEQHWLAETIVSACGLTGAMLLLFFLLRRSAPKLLLAGALVALALATKLLASALLFSPDSAFTWLTPGARGGLVLGLMMVAGLAFARPVAQRRLAAATFVISLVIVNMVPANPYFTATLQTWVQGKFLNFNGAAQFLSLIWPFAALWFLLAPGRVSRHIAKHK